MRRVPPTFGRVWETVYVCEWCGLLAVHVEISPAADDPHGLADELLVCECGGRLVPHSDAGAEGAAWPVI